MPSRQCQPAAAQRVSSDISIFQRTSSSIWQCRFKLPNGQWHRLSTGSSDEAQAQLVAVKLAHQWAAREQLGLPIRRPTFGTIAREVRQELEQSLAAHHGKVVYQDYITVLDKYLIPFFGSHRFEDITSEQLSEFDRWRETQNRRTLSLSTMRTHAAAFNPRTVRDAETGLRRSVDIPKRLRPWWWISEAGKVCVSIRYGSKVLELSKGKAAVEVATPDDLVSTLEAVRRAVEAGELDAQIEAASGALKAGFKN